jgi:hypothetical protein
MRFAMKWIRRGYRTRPYAASFWCIMTPFIRARSFEHSLYLRLIVSNGAGL